MAEDILHFNALRFRLTGAGNLQITIKGLDDVPTSVLIPLVMSNTPGREPLRLCNLISQRARYRVETTEINETFKINRVIVFVKPIYSSYPG